MKKAKFLQDAKLEPTRFYRNPADVIRDRRLTNSDRLEILDAWEQDVRRRTDMSEPKSGELDQVELVRRAREDLERAAEAIGNPALTPRNRTA